MALDLDGFAVFRAIASTPEAFKAIASEVNKSARTLATKQLKTKTAGIQSLRDVRRVLGSEFDFVLEGLKPSELKSLVRKYDKHNPELKGADARWCLRHLRALAAGSESPAEKPKPKARPTSGPSRKAVKKEKERLNSRAMGAVRKT
jgi:hypothetical protein